MKFCFGDIVVVEGAYIGVIVKSWISSQKGVVHEVYVRSYGNIVEYKESDIQVINGAYGPYIKHAGSNYKLPKGTEVDTLTEDKCKEIINNSTPTVRKSKRR